MRLIKFTYFPRLLFCMLSGACLSLTAQTPGFPGGNLPNRSWASGGGSIVLGYAVQNEAPIASGSFSGGNSYNVNVSGTLEPFLMETTSGTSFSEHGRFWAMLGLNVLRSRNEGLTSSVSAQAGAGMTERFTFTGPDGTQGPIEVTFYPVISDFFNVGTFLETDVIAAAFDADEILPETFGDLFVYNQRQSTGTVTASVQYRVFTRNSNGSLREVSWVNQRKRSTVSLHPVNPSSNLEDTLQPMTLSIASGQVVELVAGVSILIQSFTAGNLSDPTLSSSGSGAAWVSMQMKMSELPQGWTVNSQVGIELQTNVVAPPEYPFSLNDLPQGATSGWLNTWLGIVWIDFRFHPYVYHAKEGWIALFAASGGAYMIGFNPGRGDWLYSSPEFYPWVFNFSSEKWELHTETHGQ